MNGFPCLRKLLSAVRPAIVQSGDANPAPLVMRFSIIDDAWALQLMLAIWTAILSYLLQLVTMVQ
jgi:hypothetical protein